MRLRKGVFCVVYSGSKYLVLHRKLHWHGWEFPKGGILAHENIKHAISREVREETGLRALKIKKFNVSGKFIYDKKTRQERKFRGFSWKLYSVEVKKSKVKISRKEHDGFRWLLYGKAMRLLYWASQKRCLKIVHKTRSKI